MKDIKLNSENIEPEYFFNIFLAAYKYYQGKDFEMIKNEALGRKFAQTICAYFLKRKSFFSSPLICKKNKNSFEKGLMIIGNFGTGKTSVMKTFHSMFSYAIIHNIQVKVSSSNLENLSKFRMGFGFHTCNDVVREFERLQSGEDKSIFWKKYENYTRCFDDLTTESQASNFGKIELFKEILEQRYSNNAKTYVTLNYYGDTVEQTLEFIATKYGERVYDRIFEMFNIVELKGNSFRE